jgi:hypothetical protein
LLREKWTGQALPTASGGTTLRRFYELGVERYSGTQRPRDTAAAGRAIKARGIDAYGGLGGSGAAEIGTATGHRAGAIDDGDAARTSTCGGRRLIGGGET